MIRWNRLGTGLFGIAGLFLAGLMVYTLFFTGSSSTGGKGSAAGGLTGPTVRVAIFLPDSQDWADFRLAVLACERKLLVRLVAEQGDRLIVASTRSGRQIQFERHNVRGVSDTRAEVRRLVRDSDPPVVFVGSTTSVLTVAIAESLRDEGAKGPLLAIPWATAVMVQRPADEGGEARPDLVPLIEIDPERTFRFCPNNRRLADSVVDCLVARDEGRLPSRVFLVVDPFDPYSDDLASCFRQVIRARQPDVEIVERADAVDLPSFTHSTNSLPEPSPAENKLADAILTSRESNDIRPTWVVLPLQDQPARRLITALRRRSAWETNTEDLDRTHGPLRVVCGDAIEREALHEMAGAGGLSIWCASTSATVPTDQGVTDNTQTLAEITAALVWAVDQAPTATPNPDQIRQSWKSIDLAADNPITLGRRLAFEPNGERRGDLERVIAIQPGRAEPVEFARAGGASWEPVTIPAQATGP